MQVSQRKAGIVLSYLGQIIHILTGLFYTPVMLRLLGQNEYGLYQLVYSVVSYLGLLSLGFGASYVRFYSRYKAEEDEKSIAKLNGMFMIIFCTISFICIACGAVMVMNIQGIFGGGLTDSEYEKARILMAFMIFNLALTFPNSVFNCIITAHERFIFQKTLILLQCIANPFFTLPLLLLGYGSVGMVAVSTFLTGSVLLSNIFYCFKKIKTEFCFKELHFSLLREMWVFTIFIFLNQIIDQVNWSVDKYLLGRLAGTAAVAVYGVGGQINTLYLQFSVSISNVFVPKVNRIIAGSNNNCELTRLFTKVGRIQFMIMLLILTGFLFFGRTFIRLWAGDRYGESYYIALMLITPVTVPLIQNLGIEIQRARNKHKTRSVVYFFIAIANIFVSIPLIRQLGPLGAAVGTAMALFMGNILFMNWYYQRRIGLDMNYFWKHIIEIIPALLVPLFFGCLSRALLICDSWPILAAEILAYTAIYGVSIYLFGMNQEEKQMLKECVTMFHMK